MLAQRAREPDEGLQARAGRPRQPGIQMLGRELRVGQVVEQPQLPAQQEGAVEALVGLLDPAERGELADGPVLRRFEQRPARALDPAAGWRVGAVVAVPFVAADLVSSARAEPTT
jgi:hypothetical protein